MLNVFEIGMCLLISHISLFGIINLLTVFTFISSYKWIILDLICKQYLIL